jgi:hypothetical protein
MDSVQTNGQKPNPSVNGLDEVRITLRANHYSPKTEESYLNWINCLDL